MSLHHRIASARTQRGVTLVELMIAMLLGLLLTAGIIQVFVGNRQTYEFTEGMSRIQESGRMALDMLAYQTRLAGYKGCASEVQLHNNLDVDESDLLFGFQHAVRGFEASGTGFGATHSLPGGAYVPAGGGGGWSPNLTGLPAGVLSHAIPGSDILLINHVSTSSVPLVPNYNESAQIHIDTTAPDDGPFTAGELLIVSDCQKASVFRATNASTGGGGVRINIAHGTSSGNPRNKCSNWHTSSDCAPGQVYGPGSELARIHQRVYFVGTPPTGSRSGRPSLYQARLTSNATYQIEELIEGVENMQIRYGVDDGLSGAVDDYLSANDVVDWNEVVTVRIGLLVRAPDEYGTETDAVDYNVNGTTVRAPGDRRMRQVFTTTVALRNKLP